MNQVIPQEFIEMTRSEVDGMIGDLQRRDEPMTTEAIALILFDPRNLTSTEHRQALAVMSAILLQRVVYP